MRPLILIASLLAAMLLASCGPLRAQGAEVEQGTGLICDTKEQVERFVATWAGDTPAALAAVNAEAGSETACAVAAIFYQRQEEVAQLRLRKATYAIVRITVVAAMTPIGPQPLPQALEQFTLIKLADDVEA